jgi:RNase P/RNase MRP subunit p30
MAVVPFTFRMNLVVKLIFVRLLLPHQINIAYICQIIITSKHQRKDKTQKVQECPVYVRGHPLQTGGVTVERRKVHILRNEKGLERIVSVYKFNQVDYNVQR